MLLRAVVAAGDEDVGYVAAVVPVAQAAGGEDAFGAQRVEDAVGAAEEVDEEVARHAGAVVAVVAPAEEAGGVEGAVAGVLEEGVPVDGLRGGVAGDGILPGAEGVEAVVKGFHEHQLAEVAAAVDLPRLLGEDGTHPLTAHDQDAGVAFFGGEHGFAFVEPLHQRFLAVDVLAGVQRLDGDGIVPVVGGGHDDGVHVLPRQDLAVVAGEEYLVAVHFPGPFQVSGVEVAGGHQLHPFVLEGRREVAEALDAEADAGEVDAVVGGEGRGREGLRMVFLGFAQQRYRQQAGGQLTEEAAAVGHQGRS